MTNSDPHKTIQAARERINDLRIEISTAFWCDRAQQVSCELAEIAQQALEECERLKEAMQRTALMLGQFKNETIRRERHALLRAVEVDDG
jgi:hypothetical protein